MLFTWSQVVEGFLRRFYGIPEPFEAILTKLAPDKLNADTWCQQTESWLHQHGVHMHTSWNTGWEWFARYETVRKLVGGE